DPWAKREAWRKHPIFSNRAMFSNLFPGFGIALVAFTAYVVVDQLVHPSNVEQLKQQAKEAAERPTIVELLKGGKTKDQQ
ncbi:hypothetical protein P389DRAFT_141237, partial [Cystobasidium minutum MCA 4210]|uniref:uncharacterized protein n=1 Tax=Cystobasidium minutum MCA 4210 TaxID=1397322 RepID=UPI0034CD9ED5